MTNPIIETVSFKLASGVTESAFKAEVPASSAFSKARTGFRARRLKGPAHLQNVSIFLKSHIPAPERLKQDLDLHRLV